MTTSVCLRINVLKYFQIYRKIAFVSNLLAFQLFCLAALAESLMFPDFPASGDGIRRLDFECLFKKQNLPKYYINTLSKNQSFFTNIIIFFIKTNIFSHISS